jgi:hypothetical protein
MKQIIFYIFLISVYQSVHSADGGAPQPTLPRVDTEPTKKVSLKDFKTITELSTHLHRTKKTQIYLLEDIIDAVTFCSEEKTECMRKLFVLHHINAQSTKLTVDTLRTIIFVAAKAPEQDYIEDGMIHIHSIHTHYLRTLKSAKTITTIIEEDLYEALRLEAFHKKLKGQNDHDI